MRSSCGHKTVPGRPSQLQLGPVDPLTDCLRSSLANSSSFLGNYSCYRFGSEPLLMRISARSFTFLWFLPRCMECRRGIAMIIMSVRLTNERIVTKRKKDLSRFLYHTKDHLT